MTKEELIEIRRKADGAKDKAFAMGHRNTWGLTIEEKIDLDTQYKIAYDEWEHLENCYQKAFRQYVKNKEMVEQLIEKIR